MKTKWYIIIGVVIASIIAIYLYKGGSKSLLDMVKEPEIAKIKQLNAKIDSLKASLIISKAIHENDKALLEKQKESLNIALSHLIKKQKQNETDIINYSGDFNRRFRQFSVLANTN